MKNLKSLAILPVGKYEVTDAAGAVQYQDDGVTPMTITHHSPGTKVFQAALHAFNAKGKNGLIAAMKQSKDDKGDPEAEARDLAVFLAAVTISFDGFGYEDLRGNAMFRAAYEDVAIGHIAEGLNQYMGKRGNYLAVLATTSNDSSALQPG